MTTIGYVSTTGGLRDAGMDLLTSDDPKAVAEFLNGQTATAGYKLCYAIDHALGAVVALYKRGKFAQRDARILLEAGFTEFAFSWAWAPKTWDIDGKRVEVSADLELHAGSMATVRRQR